MDQANCNPILAGENDCSAGGMKRRRRTTTPKRRNAYF